MKYNPDIHHRRSIRLKKYDYAQAGAYFATICTHNRECLFCDVMDGKMILNDIGHVTEKCRHEIVDHFQRVKLDEFIIMPNHLHGILIIADCRGTACRAPTMEQFGQPVPGSIPTIIRSFKSAVTKHINQMYETPGVKLWQRNYYEHFLRNEYELNRIREYIVNNPMKWEFGRHNPVVSILETTTNYGKK
jgi:REP element-mobilizing transposase RayT